MTGRVSLIEIKTARQLYEHYFPPTLINDNRYTSAQLNEQTRQKLIEAPENTLRVILGMAIAEDRQKLVSFILNDMMR